MAGPFRVSLRTVIIAAVCVVAAASAIVAFLPLYYYAYDSADDIARRYAVTVTNYVGSELTGLTEKMSVALNTLDTSLRRWCINVSDSESVVGLIAYAYVATNTSTSLYLDNGKYFNFAVQSVFNASVHSPQPTSVGVATVGDTAAGTATFSYRHFSNASVVASLPPPFTQANPYNVSTRPFYQTIRNNRGWAAPFVDISGLFTSMFIGLPVFDALTAHALVGAVGIKLVVENNVVAFLRTINIAKTGRVLLLDTTSRTFFGGNIPDPSVVQQPNGTMRMATIGDISDPIVVDAMAALGGPNGLFACDAPCDLSTIPRGASALQDGSHSFFVRVVSIPSTLGLTMRVVVVIPASDFLDGMRNGAILGIILTVCSVVVLMCLAAVAMVGVLRPLKNLEQRLTVAAAFKNDASVGDVGAAPGSDAEKALPLQSGSSMFSEIWSMEDAYSALHTELCKVKSFLPQSVLRQLHSSDGEIGEEGGADEEDEGTDVAAAAALHGEHTTASRSPHTSSVQRAPTQPLEDAPANPFVGAQPADSPSFLSGVETPSRRSSNTPQALPTFRGVVAQTSGASAGSGQLRNMSSGESSPSNSASSPAQSHKATSRSRRARHTSVGLNILSTLTERRITVLVCNVSRFHAMLQSLGPTTLQKHHAAVVAHMLAAVNRAHGVLDSFFGDHFTVTFNASSPCAQHAIRAAAFIANTQDMLMHAAADYSDSVTVAASSSASNRTGTSRRGRGGVPTAADGTPWSLRIGCATGKAVCGNFGSDQMRRFSAVGVVVNHAHALMQQCRTETVFNAVDAATFDSAAHEVPMRHINYVVLPQAQEGRLISTVLDGQMLRMGGCSLELVRQVNDAFHAFARGDLATAKGLTSQLPREYAGDLVKCLRSVMQSLAAVS